MTESPNVNTTAATGPAEGAERAAADKRHILLIFAGLMVTMLLASLDQMIFSTALPTIVGELNGVNHMLWVTTAYILASTIMMPIYGKLGDLIGRKGLFIGAISIFIVGSVIGGLAQDMTWLIAGRAVQGLGGGGLLILAQAIIADVVPARQRGKYMGIMGAVFAISSVAGPLLGGWFTDGIGWRWAFWMNIPLGLLAIASAVFFLRLPKNTNRNPSIDIAGMTLLAVASTCLVLFTTWGGNTYDWSSPVIIGLIIGALVAGGLFVSGRAARRRADHAAAPVQGAQLQPGHRRRADHRYRDVRCAGLPADLPADGDRRQRHRGRPADDPADGRPADHLRRIGTAGQQDRTLQVDAHDRHGAGRGLAVPAVHPDPGSWRSG